MSVRPGELAVTGLRITGETELVHGVDLVLAPGEMGHTQAPAPTRLAPPRLAAT